MTPDDWAFAAYEAARRGDNEAIVATLKQIIDVGGSDAMQWAARRWMHRTHYVMAHAGRFHGFELTADNSPDDLPKDVDQAPQVAAWSGRLFMAYCANDRALWQALWRLVDDTADGLSHAGYAVLRMMTLTASAYIDELGTDGPAVRAARMSLAHLN